MTKSLFLTAVAAVLAPLTYASAQHYDLTYEEHIAYCAAWFMGDDLLDYPSEISRTHAPAIMEEFKRLYPNGEEQRSEAVSETIGGLVFVFGHEGASVGQKNQVMLRSNALCDKPISDIQSDASR
ncbi:MULTISPECIES: hypothetical protein [unclassified Octadecabacter]|uniref:hypothetical protein n=1 Tax=unclassified Octadecabacter TaxID=196158 RepID=UPI001C08FD6B|nr:MULTISPECIES: hypothetical protein [unclassified Octadecabacter]MBU2992951.1 hypothetical protein [Octadecabacter sp. B2R22]